MRVDEVTDDCRSIEFVNVVEFTAKNGISNRCVTRRTVLVLVIIFFLTLAPELLGNPLKNIFQ